MSQAPDGNAKIMQPDIQSEKPVSKELTGEETALYDRQIRLWGLEAQRKLASSSVLITGDVCSLTAQEVAKNFVLAGIGRLAFMPDINHTFKQTRSFLGDNIDAITQNLAAMNPHVHTFLCDQPLADAVNCFSMVCAIGMPLKKEKMLSHMCRNAQVPFLTGRVTGIVGWLFLDLGKEHTYQATTSAKAAGAEASTSIQIKRIPFCSYQNALDATWRRETKRSGYGWHVARSFQEFESRHDRLPIGENEDLKLIKELYIQLCEQNKCQSPNPDLIERVCKTTSCNLAPVSAVLGGMWAREAIKVVSGRGEPLNNFFFFNADTNTGSVETISPAGQ